MNMSGYIDNNNFKKFLNLLSERIVDPLDEKTTQLQDTFREVVGNMDEEHSDAIVFNELGKNLIQTVSELKVNMDNSDFSEVLEGLSSIWKPGEEQMDALNSGITEDVLGKLKDDIVALENFKMDFSAIRYMTEQEVNDMMDEVFA